MDLPIYTRVPSFDVLLPTLKDVIASARKIPAGSAAAWKSHVWVTELNRLSELFDTAMIDPTPINLFNAVYNFVVAPGAVLGPCFKTPALSSTESVSNAVTTAINKILRGQERKALKMLCSNGVAKVDRQALSALKKLHPERKSVLLLPKSDIPQLTVDPAFLAKKLFLDSGDHNVSKDVFGWAPWLFYGGRGEKKGFFPSFVTFACFLANNPTLFPKVCSLLLSGGALTPLHKLNFDERREREDACLPPKLRPINSGSLLTKVILSAVLASPAGERAASVLRRFNCL